MVLNDPLKSYPEWMIFFRPYTLDSRLHDNEVLADLKKEHSSAVGREKGTLRKELRIDSILKFVLGHAERK